MVIPFEVDRLFEVNEDYSVTKHSTGALIIDNIYKNYDDILNVLRNMPAPKWKSAENSRNFIDYYDCRPMIRASFRTDKSIAIHKTCVSLLESLYNESAEFSVVTKLYEFNFFKNIKKDISNNLQHMPHRDVKYAALIYLDEVASGGTALYDNKLKIENTEDQNIYYDISDIKKEVIPSKPNRLIIFDGTKLHGGYIENHNDYLDAWRINQPIFFEKR